MGKKLSKKNIFSIFTTVVALIVLIVATLAWFANNTKVAARNMQVQVKSNSSLVIADSAEHLVAITRPSDAMNLIFTDFPTLLTPCRHDTTKTGSEYTSGLWTITDPTAVNLYSGLEVSGGEMGYKHVPIFDETQSEIFYIQKEIYLAASAEAINNQHLIITMSPDKTREGYDKVSDAAGNPIDSFQAASIDIYFPGDESVALDEKTYTDTLNIAGRYWNWEERDENYEDKCDSIPDACQVINNIPSLEEIKAGTANPLHITLRYYFDGGLLKTTGQTYITSDTVSTLDFGINVLFEIRDITD